MPSAKKAFAARYGIEYQPSRPPLAPGVQNNHNFRKFPLQPPEHVSRSLKTLDASSYPEKLRSGKFMKQTSSVKEENFVVTKP
jgi:hypothetical protein